MGVSEHFSFTHLCVFREAHYGLCLVRERLQMTVIRRERQTVPVDGGDLEL